MNKILLIVNRPKDPEGVYQEKIIEYIQKYNKSYIVVDEEEYSLKEINLEGVDAMITLGGDGTLIRAARNFASYHLPILGINIGTLGYLTAINFKENMAALDHFLQGKYFVEERMMLTGHLETQNTSFYALNDIVIHRGYHSLLEFEVYVNGEKLNHYKGDGMIIATPTGSSAYNLSVGGPLVDPSSEMILLTPIAPHTLNTRSIVLSGQSQIEVRLKGKTNEKLGFPIAQFDGDKSLEFRPNDRLLIKQGDLKIKIVKLRKESFLETLRRKMRNN